MAFFFQSQRIRTVTKAQQLEVKTFALRRAMRSGLLPGGASLLPLAAAFFPNFPLCALLVLVAPGPCGSWPLGFAGHGSVPFGRGCASPRVRSLPLHPKSKPPAPGVGKCARAAQILGLRWGQEGGWHGDAVGDEHQPVTQRGWNEFGGIFANFGHPGVVFLSESGTVLRSGPVL